MGTAQQDRPLLHDSKESIYDLLRRSIENQTYSGPIEVIVADTDEARMARENGSWGRATRVVLAKQVLHDRIAIAGARNTAASYARGDLLIFVDDCTELWPSFVRAAVRIYERDKIPTRLLLTSRSRPHTQPASTRDLLQRGLAEDHFEEIDPLWRDEGHPIDSSTWKLSGQAGGVFVIPRKLYMKLNGFDENFDGNWGCEDQEFCKRLDRLKVLRVSTCDLAVVRWPHDKTPVRATLRRCREAYAQWAYRSSRIAANRRLLDGDLEALRTAPPCSDICDLCKADDRPAQIETYRTIPADFDLRALHAIYSARPSGIYLDPWR
jgi:glycosyltransferase involved in cell wall biosynthesis